MRSGDDELVSGSSLAAGIILVPGGGASSISIQDEPTGRGKLATFSDGGVTPSSDYQIVISAAEEVITNVDDPFLKNVNIPESTAQKLRLVYRINVVPKAAQTSKPVPYTGSIVGGNLTNYIEVIPQTSANGSEVSRSVITGSEAIDGRNLEIIIRNNTSGSNPSYSGSPVGNLIPVGTSEQSEYSNGTLIDSNGQSYHLNLIFNDTVANQVILRIDSEVNQPQPVLTVGKSYKLYKKEVYVTDDNAGSPLGKLFWPVANVTWNSTDGFVHESKVEDLRAEIENLASTEDTTTVKFNLKLTGGGIVTAEPTVKASGTITVINNSFDVSDAVIINGKSFVYNVDWAAGGTTTLSASNIVTAINNSLSPLVANIVTASSSGSIVTITAVHGGTAGNSLTLAESDGSTDNFTLSGATLTGGLDGTPGEVTWDDDFKIVNPNGPTQTILTGSSVIREGGAVAYLMDLAGGGPIGDGNISVTTTTNGTNISLSGVPDLSKVKIGNTLVVGQESTSITSINDFTKTVEVFPSLTGTGAATIYQDTYASGTAPVDPNIFVLAVKTGSIIQVTGRGEFQPGESSVSGVPIQLLQYIGSTGETDDSPNYNSNTNINDGDNLTLAISKLDAATGALQTLTSEIDARENQDRNAKLVRGGTWHWDSGTNVLAWSADANVQISGLTEVVNLIVQGQVSLTADGQCAYVSLNRVGPGGTLSVLTASIASVPTTDDIFILARRLSSDVLVGHSFLLKTGDYLELDGALAEIDRKLGQLKLTKHETAANKARISAADIVQLDLTTLSQELSSYLMDFDGAVINFTTGSVLKSDDSTALGVNFTPFSIPVGQYFWYGIGLLPSTVTAANRINAQVQIVLASAANASQSSALFPTIVGDKKLGAIQVHNNAGTIEIVDVRRLGVGSGSGSGGSGLVKANLYDPSSSTLPSGISPTIDGTTLLENDLVFFTNLGSGNNRIYKATNVTTSVVWTVQRLFSSSSETPTAGDAVRISKGTLFSGQVVYLDSSGNYTVNDTIRLFDGNKGTNYWELSSLKTIPLLDNQSGAQVFSVNATNSENWIIHYSVVRGAANRETGQIYITSNDTIARATVNNAYFGDTGVTFSTAINAGNLQLLYTTTSTGTDASMKFFVSRWSDSAGGPSGVPSYPTGSSTPAAGSINDLQFKGSSGDLDASDLFKVDVANSSLALDGLLIGTLQGPVILLNNQTATNIFTYAYAYKWVIIEYSLERDGDTQVGRLLLTNNNSIVVITDDYISTAALGISFSASISGSNVVIKYDSTATSFNASFKYSIRRWQ